MSVHREHTEENAVLELELRMNVPLDSEELDGHEHDEERCCGAEDDLAVRGPRAVAYGVLGEVEIVQQSLVGVVAGVGVCR